jgi:NAD(P)-dependent dehydrogenase (short-subunit alcohol dehydrogenase family)
MRFGGKVAIVTGSGRGIGRATAEQFAAEGAAVVIAEVDERCGEATVEAIRQAGGEATFVRTDVSNSEQVGRMVETALDVYGQIDILFNCAGVLLRASLTDTEEEDWDRVMAVNLKGVYLCSKHVLPHMISRGRGTIINASSVVGLHGAFAEQAAYCASKAGVTMLTKAMTLDYARHGIRVNCVCPGPTETEMMCGNRSQEALQEVAESFPIGRMAKPREIAAAVLFLASSDASFITGHALTVDGGQTAER